MKTKIKYPMFYTWVSSKDHTIYHRGLKKVVKLMFLFKYELLVIKDDNEWVLAEASTGLMFFRVKKLPVLLKLADSLKYKTVVEKMDKHVENLNRYKRHVFEAI